MTPTNDIFTQIAREHLGIQTLEARNSDGLDFHEVAVWQIEKALRVAYEAGCDATRRKKPQPNAMTNKPCRRL